MKRKFLFLFLLFIPFQAHAAVLSFRMVPAQALTGGLTTTGGATSIEVWMDPQGQTINSIAGVIHLRSARGMEKKYSLNFETGGSVFSLWPTPVGYSATNSVISFSGGVIGGFDAPAQLFSFQIATPVPDQLTLSWIGGGAYLNDGRGTEVPIGAQSLTIALSPTTSTSTTSAMSADKTPPQFDTIEIGRDPNTYEGKWFVSFHATDDASGLDHYVVSEGSATTTVTNGVYVFHDQTLRTPVFITAFDRAGNERTVEVPLPSAHWLKDLLVIILIIMAIALALWFGHKKFRLFGLLLLCSALFGFAGSAHAAGLSLVGNTSDLHVGDIVTVKMLVNSDGQAINSASGQIDFPTASLQALSISEANSIFSLWVQKPTFSNSQGNISFDGGIPNPGFNGTAGDVFDVTFRATQAGPADLSFGQTAVLANDGSGTNVLQTAPGLNLGSIAPAPKPVPTATTSTTPPAQPATFASTTASTTNTISTTSASSPIQPAQPFAPAMPPVNPPSSVGERALISLVELSPQLTAWLLVISALCALIVVIYMLRRLASVRRDPRQIMTPPDLAHLHAMITDQINLLERAHLFRSPTKEEKILLGQLKSWQKMLG
jgi:hypothetical protein